MRLLEINAQQPTVRHRPVVCDARPAHAAVAHPNLSAQGGDNVGGGVVVTVVAAAAAIV